MTQLGPAGGVLAGLMARAEAGDAAAAEALVRLSLEQQGRRGPARRGVCGRRGVVVSPMAPAATAAAAARRALRPEVEGALLAELERVGPEGLNRAAVLRRFEGRGADRATLFRWAAALLASGRAGQHLARTVRAAAAERAARAPAAPAADAAREAVERLPVAVRPEDIAGGGPGPIAVIERLQLGIRATEQVMAHARDAEGRVRNARALLAATETLRRCLETAARLHEAMRSVNDVDRFHAAVLAEVAKEAPETAERIVRRLTHLARWGGDSTA
jgi:hypothetical protein